MCPTNKYPEHTQSAYSGHFVPGYILPKTEVLLGAPSSRSKSQPLTCACFPHLNARASCAAVKMHGTFDIVEVRELGQHLTSRMFWVFQKQAVVTKNQAESVESLVMATSGVQSQEHEPRDLTERCRKLSSGITRNLPKKMKCKF